MIAQLEDGVLGVQPIELTPEILEECGFVLFPWGWVSNVANKRSLRITTNFYFKREGQSPLRIKYVHQLQNLYFSLTEEELVFSSSINSN
jgi:hypothetical protein